MRTLSLLIICILVTGLTSCSPRGLSAEDYQELVIRTLKGSEEGSLLPGLIPTIGNLFASLGCVEADCYLPDEFFHIGDVAELVENVAADREGKICHERVHPPAKMKDTHRLICESLEAVRKAADAMKITARLAAQLLTQGFENPSSRELIRSYSAKIIDQKRRIVEALRSLEDIPWLKGLFEGVLPEGSEEQGHRA